MSKERGQSFGLGTHRQVSRRQPTAGGGGESGGLGGRWWAMLSCFFSSSEEAGEEPCESGGREVGDGATKGSGG